MRVDLVVALAVLLALPLALLLAALAWVVGLPWWLGPLIGLVVAAGFIWRRAESADRLVLAKLAAIGTVSSDTVSSDTVSSDTVSSDTASAEPSSTAVARLENLVEGLCLSIGVPEPDLVVIADPARNAMAVARQGRQILVVTEGLLSDLGRVELEGVVAELLVRLRSGDAEHATVMASLVGDLLLESPLARVARPLAARFMRKSLDFYRDVAADQQAVAVTRYPPGLWAGLERIGNGDRLPRGATTGIDHLWIVPPQRAAALFDFAPLEWRIDVLMEI